MSLFSGHFSRIAHQWRHDDLSLPDRSDPDYQLSKVRWKFDDQVLTLKSRCCPGMSLLSEMCATVLTLLWEQWDIMWRMPAANTMDYKGYVRLTFPVGPTLRPIVLIARATYQTVDSYMLPQKGAWGDPSNWTPKRAAAARRGTPSLGRAVTTMHMDRTKIVWPSTHPFAGFEAVWTAASDTWKLELGMTNGCLMVVVIKCRWQIIPWVRY